MDLSPLTEVLRAWIWTDQSSAPLSQMTFSLACANSRARWADGSCDGDSMGVDTEGRDSDTHQLGEWIITGVNCVSVLSGRLHGKGCLDYSILFLSLFSFLPSQCRKGDIVLCLRCDPRCGLGGGDSFAF